MKIFKIIMICSCLMTFLTITAIADTSTATTTGGDVVAFGGTPALNFTPSPSTIMAVETTALAYAVTSGSTKTTTETGIMYGVLSSRSPVYQYAQQADGELVAPSSATSLGSNWEDKSGNSAP